MAFTDVETARVHDAVNTDPSGEDLCKLGLLYSTGQGGTIDFIEAHKWFNLAAMRGMLSAQIDRAEVADTMSNGEISEAQRKAREWMVAH